MTGGYSDPQKNREYMREYMRRYRGPNCTICGKELAGRKALYCGRKCRQHAYHLRHGEANRARYRAWHQANLKRSVERVRAWRQANPERFREYITKWRRQACPYCDGKLTWPAKSCRECSVRYGCLCHDNPSCGMTGPHKHCPCGIPIATRKGHYHIEPCAFCLREMARLGVTFAQLFELARKADAEFQEAA